MSETRTVLIGADLASFQAKHLGLSEPDAKKEPEVKAEPEQKVDEVKPEIKSEEPEKQEEIKKEDEPTEKKRNPKLEKRFSDLTQRRDDALNEAQRERELRQAAERKAAELEAKLNPKKAEEDPKPKASEFTDAFEYAEKLSDWSARNAAKEALAKRDKEEFEKSQHKQKEQFIEQWETRVAATKAEIPDYEDVVGSSDLSVSDPVKDAITYSEIGPRILFHLADNPDLVEKINKMKTPIDQIKAIHKLEARLEDATLVAKKTETKEKIVPVISKALPPITPLKSSAAPPEDLIDHKGNVKVDYATYKAKRLSGEIK